MAINTQTIRIDLNTGRTIPVAFAHQNDTNRQLTFQLYNNGVAFTPSSTTVKFAYKSPIVNGRYSVITGSQMASGTVSGNTVTVTLPSTYTAVSGVGLLTMILTTSGNTLRPVNIKFVCQGSADGDDVVLGASDWPEGLYDYMDNWLEENEPTEIANLKSDLNNTVTGNMITGYYINNANGNAVSNSSFSYCDYVEVKPSTLIELSHVAVYSSQGISFYDANKVFISAYSGSTGGDITISTIVPDNAKYLRATALTGKTVEIRFKGIFSGYIVPFSKRMEELGTIQRRTGSLKQVAVSEIKDLLTFSVGSLRNTGQNTGEINHDNRYRISSEKTIAEEDLSISIPNNYRFGVFSFDTDGTFISDSGWKNEFSITKGTIFAIQIGNNPEDTSYVFEDPYNNDAFENLEITLLDDVAWKNALANPKALSIQKTSALAYSQGACVVGDKLLGFKGSANDHSATNDIYIYDIADPLTRTANMTHNLGHCATADYCEETDAIITANGDVDPTLVPTIWFVKNAKNKISNGNSILISDSDVFSIELSTISGYGCGACFGESSDFIYTITQDDGNTKYISKILLGKGSNDYSNGGFGTFVSGSQANEYNGTAKTVFTQEITLPGEIQGLKFKNGNLFLSTDTALIRNVLTAYIVLIDIKNDVAKVNSAYEIPIYSNGNRIRTEAEGIAFYNNYGYMSVVNSGTGTIIKFPVMCL